jgi:hypothetical protein
MIKSRRCRGTRLLGSPAAAFQRSHFLLLYDTNHQVCNTGHVDESHPALQNLYKVDQSSSI